MANQDSSVKQARALMERKDGIERELETQLAILKANNATMQTPESLVDGEGFPRADIDVWAVRTARVKVIELRNDIRDVMDAIGRALEGVYDPSSTVVTDSSSRIKKVPKPESLKPFTKVESVAPGSPASEAVSCRFDI